MDNQTRNKIKEHPIYGKEYGYYPDCLNSKACRRYMLFKFRKWRKSCPQWEHYLGILHYPKGF